METLPTGKTRWELSEGALESLLAHLDPVREVAGEKYVQLLLRLARFFEHRRLTPAEEHASAVIDRLAHKLAEGVGVQNTGAYALEVARRYALELSRRPAEVQADDEWDRVASAAAPGAADSPAEARMLCFERCLDELTPQERQTVLGYYEDDRRAKIDNRKSLAERLGVNMNTLRIRVMRTQRKLERCVRECEAGA